MKSIHTLRNKLAGNESVAETGNYRAVGRSSDISLAATPTYDRAYNDFLTIEEAVQR